eukprot:CAMPEP_0197498372 /NCGR_PEP_ID=MMETSP1311-20131121/57334_1 /TAXON_ID=464262 /ORGANISM="Genus nov. species nov., Strain RCC856" /LENGTH=69 /DNA_ID=CAMNT_0043044073 /DNA_START=14 /DNA_END=220 /DNA_ORIENTATION=+
MTFSFQTPERPTANRAESSLGASTAEEGGAPLQPSGASVAAARRERGRAERQLNFSFSPPPPLALDGAS